MEAQVALERPRRHCRPDGRVRPSGSPTERPSAREGLGLAKGLCGITPAPPAQTCHRLHKPAAPRTNPSPTCTHRLQTPHAPSFPLKAMALHSTTCPTGASPFPHIPTCATRRPPPTAPPEQTPSPTHPPPTHHPPAPCGRRGGVGGGRAHLGSRASATGSPWAAAAGAAGSPGQRRWLPITYIHCVLLYTIQSAPSHDLNGLFTLARGLTTVYHTK